MENVEIYIDEVMRLKSARSLSTNQPLSNRDLNERLICSVREQTGSSQSCDNALCRRIVYELSPRLRGSSPAWTSSTDCRPCLAARMALVIASQLLTLKQFRRLCRSKHRCWL